MALSKEAVLKLRLEGFTAAERAGKAIANSMAVAEAFAARLTRQSGLLGTQLAKVAGIGTQASASLQSLEATGARAAAAIHGRYLEMFQAVAQATRGATAVASKAFGDVATAAAAAKARVREAVPQTALERVRVAAEVTAKAVKNAFPSTAVAAFGERAVTTFAKVQAAGSAVGGAITSAFTKVGFALAGIGAASFGLFKLLEIGERSAAVAGSFEKLSAAVGGATSTIGRLRQATGGAVDDQTLMLASNKLLIADLGLSQSQLAKLASAAVTLSRAMGTSAASAVRDLAEGVQKQSPMILDNLGITVRMEGALKKYAEANGIAAEAIDDRTKRLIFLQAFEEAATEAQTKLGGSATVTASATELLATKWTNLKDRFATMLAQQPGIFDGLNAITEAVVALAAALTPIVKLIAEIVSGLSKIPGLVPALAGAAAGFAVGGPVGGLIGGGIGLVSGIAGQTSATAAPASAEPVRGPSVELEIPGGTAYRTAQQSARSVGRDMRREVARVEENLSREIRSGLEDGYAMGFTG